MDTNVTEAREAILASVAGGTLPVWTEDAFKPKPVTKASTGLCSAGRHDDDVPATHLTQVGTRWVAMCVEHAERYAEAHGLTPEGAEAAPEVAPWYAKPGASGKAHHVTDGRTACGKDATALTDPAGDDELCGTCVRKVAA